MEYHVGGGAPFAMVLGERPPLGFFHNTIWCTTEHRNMRQGWQLLRPPLAMEQKLFPIPVRLFEDMHQEEFWAHVRKFNCKLHEVRAISAGVKVNLDLYGNRIDYEEVLGKPLSRLLNMLELMKMRPADKDTLAIGKAINESAVSGQAYCKFIHNSAMWPEYITYRNRGWKPSIATGSNGHYPALKRIPLKGR